LLDAQRSMKGSLFTDFFAPSDRETLQGQLQTAEQPGGVQPSALHSSLFSMGSRIRVEVIFVPFEAPDGGKQLLVGLREVGAQEMADLKSFPKKTKKAQPRKQPSSSSSSADGQVTIIGRGTRSDIEPLELDPHPCTSGGPLGEEGFASGSDSSSCSQVSRSSGLWMLMRPELARTSDEAVQISLARAMNRWNREVRGRICCNYHASVIEATRSLGILKRSPCMPDFSPGFDTWQCVVCGALGDEEDDLLDVCELCGQGLVKKRHIYPGGDACSRMNL